MTRLGEGPQHQGSHLTGVLTGLRQRIGASVEHNYACSPPQVMQALTAVTLADLVAELPAPVLRAVQALGRRPGVANWLATPVFTCALALGGSLPTTDPLRFMVLELPVCLPRMRREPAPVSIGIRLDPCESRTRARVLLLGADRRCTGFIPSYVVLRLIAPVWRVCTQAWLTAAVLQTPGTQRRQ